MMRVGLDLSLTRSGVYLGPGEFAELKGGRLRGTDRLRFLSDALFNMLDGWDVRDAIIEGLSTLGGKVDALATPSSRDMPSGPRRATTGSASGAEPPASPCRVRE